MLKSLLNNINITAGTLKLVVWRAWCWKFCEQDKSFIQNTNKELQIYFLTFSYNKYFKLSRSYTHCPRFSFTVKKLLGFSKSK